MNGEDKKYLKEILENQIADITKRFDRYEDSQHNMYDEFSKKLDRVVNETTKNSTHIKVQYGIITLLMSALLYIKFVE